MSKSSFFVGLKYVLAIAVGIYFLFALFWLNQAQSSLNLCGDPHTNLTAWDNIHITKKATGQPFTCPELLSYCKIPTLSPAQSLDSYYATRIALYIVSLVPMAIMYGGSSLHAMRLLSPITHHDQKEICCGVSDARPNEYYVYAGLSMVGTHLVGGIIAAIADIGTAQYLNGLPGVDKCSTVAKPWNSAVLDPVNYPLDADCACAALLRPNKLEGLLRLSSVELMNPHDLAIALAIPNMLYLAWGVIFMWQTFCQNQSLDTKQNVPVHINQSPWDKQLAERAKHVEAEAAKKHAAEQAAAHAAERAAKQAAAHAPPQHLPPPPVDNGPFMNPSTTYAPP